jgi:hypothetical protein
VTHDYEVSPVMWVVLPGGGRESRESCGCSTIYRGAHATYYPCRGHGGHPRTYALDEPLSRAQACGCGHVHRVDTPSFRAHAEWATEDVL